MSAIKKILFCLVVCFAGISAAHGQSTTLTLAPDDSLNYNAAQLRSMGKNAAAMGDYSSAAMYYDAYIRKRPKKYKEAYQLAEYYRLSKEYRKAQDAYLRAYNMNPKANALALYHYANSLRTFGNYEKADEYYAKFKKEYKGSDKGDYLKLIKGNGKAAEFAQAMMKKPVKVAVEHLPQGINTFHVEAAPYYLNDSNFIYSSLKTGQTTFDLNPEDSSNNEPFRKFYVASRGDSGLWKEDGEMPGEFNAAGVHSTNGVYSADGNRFYFTRCKRNNKNKVICAIYLSLKNNGVWTEPQSIGEDVNDPQYSNTQPAVGYDSQKKNQEVIYFVSDREGGKGGTDIWYTTFDNKSKKFKTPSNAGTKINTAGDEVTPFVDPQSKVFYFSSDGWQGLGGLDVFKTNGELKKWSTPENMGFPLNSNYDDLYYVLAPVNKENGLLVSNRPVSENGINKGACCDDIFEVHWLDLVKLRLKGLLYEQEDSVKKGMPIVMDPVRRAKILLELKNLDDSTFISVGGSTTDETGHFALDLIPNREYRLTAKKEGYLNEIIPLNTMGKTKSADISIDIHIRAIPETPLRLANIYYEFASANLTEGAKNSIDTTLLRFMDRNSELAIEIGSHTDNIGSDESNMNLSQRRAESVVQYLTVKGVDPNRLRSTGYGESKPIAANQLSNGKDNPKGRQLNRRTEFKILGKMRDGKIREDSDF